MWNTNDTDDNDADACCMMDERHPRFLYRALVKIGERAGISTDDAEDAIYDAASEVVRSYGCDVEMQDINNFLHWYSAS